MSFDYIFFDLDGTIVDSAPGIFTSIKYALSVIEFEDYDEQEFRRFLGPPLKESFMKIFGFDEEKADFAVDIYRRKYEKGEIFNASLYEDIRKLLAYLKSKDKKIVLATAKPEKFAKIILEHFELSEYFHYIGGASLDDGRADKSAVIKYLLETLEITDVSKILMVGDRENDVLGAADYGISTLGVLYGYGSEIELRNAGAKYLAADVKEAVSIIMME